MLAQPTALVLPILRHWFLPYMLPPAPPLHIQSASLRELRLREQGLAALDDAAAAAPEQAPATATWRVQLPTGLGALVVDGTVTVVSRPTCVLWSCCLALPLDRSSSCCHGTASSMSCITAMLEPNRPMLHPPTPQSLPLRCEFCGEPFERALQAVPFDAVVYLGDSGSELAANELLFEMDQGFVDLTPVVCDSLLGSLPTVCLCGGASCAQHAGKEVGWTAPAAAPAAASSPFAKLLAAKGGAGGSNGSGSGKKGKRR